MESKECLSVVMPVYNEEKSIVEIINRVLQQQEVGELIAINDGSTDKSFEAMQVFAGNPRVKLINQPHNCGKGAAIIRGFEEAKCPYVIIQDADFEYDPAEYGKLLRPLLEDKADIVYGSRFMATPGLVRYFAHEMGNKFLTLMSNLFSDIHLSDMETCYKCFKREVIQNMILGSQRFGIEVEMTAKFAKSRALRIWEEPISYNPRRYAEGKKITWKDGFAALWHIIVFNCFTSPANSWKKPWDEVLNNRKEKEK